MPKFSILEIDKPSFNFPIITIQPTLRCMHISSTVPWYEWLLFLVFILVARKISRTANRSHHGGGDSFSNSADGHGGGDCGSDGGTH
jgi:hypothetical protein